MFKRNRTHHQRRRRLSYANVMSTIAVFLVVAGEARSRPRLPPTASTRRRSGSAASFLSNNVYKAESAVTAGTILGDGTQATSRSDRGRGWVCPG
jgi:hypothetical protein